jgi:methylmalonyl-CoA mutase
VKWAKKFLWFRTQNPLLIWNCRSNRKIWRNSIVNNSSSKIIWYFQNYRIGFRKCSWITKVRIDDTTVYPSAIKEHRNNIFLNLLLNQFDKVKMDLDPYNWEVILTWTKKNKYKILSTQRWEIRSLKTHSGRYHSQIQKTCLNTSRYWDGATRKKMSRRISHSCLPF